MGKEKILYEIKLGYDGSNNWNYYYVIANNVIEAYQKAVSEEIERSDGELDGSLFDLVGLSKIANEYNKLIL